MKLPTSWKEVTIKQFIRITDVLKSNLDQEDKIIHSVNVFLEDQRRDVMNMKGKEILDLFKDLAFINTPIDESIKLSFTLKGKKYIVEERMQQLTTGQLIDLDHFIVGRSHDFILDNLHNILAIIALPAKRYWLGWKQMPYEGESHEERAKLFYDHLTIDIAYPLAVFFYNLSNALKDLILTYTEEHIKAAGEAISKEIRTLTSKRGEHTSSLTKLQGEILARRKRFSAGLSRNS